MTEFKCMYCSKTFTLKTGLKRHQTTVKYCLEIQRKLNVEVVDKLKPCEYCNVPYDPLHMKRHLLTCKKKAPHDIRLHEEKIQRYEEQLRSQAQMYEEKLKKMETELNMCKGKLEILKDDHECLISMAKEPKTSNTTNTTNTTVNKILNMSALNLDKERLENIILTQLTHNHGAGGQKGIAEFVDEHVLIDDTGKSTLVCTDPSRKVFKYLDNDGKVCKANNCCYKMYETVPFQTRHWFEKQLKDVDYI